MPKFENSGDLAVNEIWVLINQCGCDWHRDKM